MVEERIAHLEKTVDDLSDVVARQDREIEALKRTVAALVARAKEQEGGGGHVFGDDRPPHY